MPMYLERKTFAVHRSIVPSCILDSNLRRREHPSALLFFSEKCTSLKHNSIGHKRAEIPT